MNESWLEFYLSRTWKILAKSENCDCYECVGPEYIWSQTRPYKTVKNNMKWHTWLEPCPDCGEPKTDKFDGGHKGYYTCYCYREQS